MVFQFVQPLDLQTIFVDNLAGNMTIFIILFLLFLAVMSARFRLPTFSFVGLLLVTLTILYLTDIGQGSGIIPVLLLTFVIMLVFVLSNLLKRGTN